MKPIYILSLLAKNLLNHNKKDCYLKKKKKRKSLCHCHNHWSLEAARPPLCTIKKVSWASRECRAHPEEWLKGWRPPALPGTETLSHSSSPPHPAFLSKLFQLALIPEQFSSFKTIFIHSHQLTLKKKIPSDYSSASKYTRQSRMCLRGFTICLFKILFVVNIFGVPASGLLL